jgi:DNA (cytosine-5)-methyltransferase 3A
MNVLSLFDGISCARVALDRAGIRVKTYYASEIDKNAIRVSHKNYPDIVRLGDVREIKELPEPIDLLIGGSPCQDLSIANKGRQGLNGNRSSLFWEYVRLWKDLKPKWFILENVASMPKADMNTISEAMGVQPILINASLVSAQSRKRLFWTNIPDVKLPDDRGIPLKDILQPDADVDERFVVNGKSLCLTASYSKTSKEPKGKAPTQCRGPSGGALPTLVKIGHVGNSDSQGSRVYSTTGKSVTLSANGGGLGANTGLYLVPADATGGGVRVGHEVVRRLDERGVRKDDDESLPYTRIIEVRGDEKCGTLTSVQKDNYVVEPHRIRKLTPIECERLQGLPDNYTEGVAITNRYKCLGNAFHVEVVAHILRSAE